MHDWNAYGSRVIDGSAVVLLIAYLFMHFPRKLRMSVRMNTVCSITLLGIGGVLGGLGLCFYSAFIGH